MLRTLVSSGETPLLIYSNSAFDTKLLCCGWLHTSAAQALINGTLSGPIVELARKMPVAAPFSLAGNQLLMVTVEPIITVDSLIPTNALSILKCSTEEFIHYKAGGNLHDGITGKKKALQ